MEKEEGSEGRGSERRRGRREGGVRGGGGGGEGARRKGGWEKRDSITHTLSTSLAQNTVRPDSDLSRLAAKGPSWNSTNISSFPVWR